MASDRIEKLKVKKPDPKPGAAPPAQAGGKKLGAGKPPKGGKNAGKPPRPEPLAADPAARITYSCGHYESVGFVQGHPCLACLSARKKENKQKERAKHRERQGPDGYRVPDRLPAGAQKLLVWNGELWVGFLEIPDVSEKFASQAPTERGCCIQLHKVWAEYAEELERKRDKSVAIDGQPG